MRKLLAITLVLILALPALALGESSPTKGTIVVGIYEPASGDNGAGGKQETLGVRYAHSLYPTVELSDGVYDVKLVEVDNQSSNDKAPSAAQQLVSEGASIVLGSYGSSVSIAAADIFAQSGLVAIAISATNPQVTLGNPLYYRICYLDPFQGTVLAEFAVEELGAKKAYTLAQLGNDYDVGLVNYFSSAFEASGGTVLGETFPEGTSDFTAYLTKAKNEGADVIFSPPPPPMQHKSLPRQLQLVYLFRFLPAIPGIAQLSWTLQKAPKSMSMSPHSLMKAIPPEKPPNSWQALKNG